MFFYKNSQGNDVSIYFSEGSFDNYCVYVNEVPSVFRHAMKDKEYFNWILLLSKQYGVNQVWDDFCDIYDNVSMNPDDKVNPKEIMLKVVNIDMHYTEDTIKWWLVFYMTMVAECKKKYAILKKRIKKLGVYNVLIDGWNINYVVEYMKNMHWTELNELMKERGI